MAYSLLSTTKDVIEGLSSNQSSFMILFSSLAGILILLPIFGPKLFQFLGRIVGLYLQNSAGDRRRQLLSLIANDEQQWDARENGRRDSEEWENVERHTIEISEPQETRDLEWDGIIGFFHPFCNAGGGGERVLWAAVRATQKTYPKAKCVIYTGDHEVDKRAILARVKNSFNINLHAPTVTFLYLTTRSWVLASSWPRFTLLGQSIGSLILAWDAFGLMIPDIFVDTMGFAFSLALCKVLFPYVPTAAYVHYPTISIDMLQSLDSKSCHGNQGIHAGKGAGVAGMVKKMYWLLFAKAYSVAGGSIDIVMTNSTWTLGHITSLWDLWRRRFNKSPAVVVYPPVAVEEVERAIDISQSTEKQRQPILLYIAQFRPEKNHQLIIKAFAAYKKKKSALSSAKLVLVGSIRDQSDSLRVYSLRLLVNELQIKNSVEFHIDASWPEILQWLTSVSVGVNGMWNEHFGIGVVEYQAAGLITVVHNSGGPKEDIVTLVDGKPTGFHASTIAEYAQCFEEALGMPDGVKVEMRQRARRSADRFNEGNFISSWNVQLDKLVQLHKQRQHG
ncbi:BgTH12-04277 [Blumeria graminis f. sp. triticale]|uniref:GDP-Man:Man(3)GlcNAc(2)-PP-Dol alpha-1,2-mannosyltransferase n=3 Tax=Blumeria graminis TaxID=34373 RepID=A0A061HMX7_BLUGR|nr:Alpha-12-mannosyltransferase [Blumeria graminis f. sp. tritici 96224]CAD6500174.1 BgTH12-04277 [Blumeria graminis f. sp. triticale]VCU40416.1 Bgt-4508 [Blumeria graminis f. sp. tritici]